MQKHESYNVVLVPPVDIAQKAIHLSRLIAKTFPVEFVLDGKKLYPHLTLYQLEIPNINLPIAKKELSRILKKKVRTNFQNCFGSESGFLSWDCERNKDLFDLHKEIVDKLDPLRNGLLLPAKKLKYDFLTKRHQTQIEKFGSSGLFEDFRPHITITRIKNGKGYKKALKILPSERTLSVNFAEAALGKLSTHGTVTGIIEKYALS